MLTLPMIVRRFAALVALIGIVVLLVQEDQGEHSPAFIGSSLQKPYATLSEGTIRQYDEQGQPSAVVFMDQAFYYEESDAVDLSMPRMEFQQDAEHSIVVTANSGRYHPGQQILELAESVKLVRKSERKDDLVIETDRLEVDNRQRFISTDRAVTITQGQQRMQAVGMQADMDDRRVELLSRVKGRYVLDNK